MTGTKTTQSSSLSPQSWLITDEGEYLKIPADDLEKVTMH